MTACISHTKMVYVASNKKMEHKALKMKDWWHKVPMYFLHGLNEILHGRNVGIYVVENMSKPKEQYYGILDF